MKKIAKRTLTIVLIAGMIAAALPMAAMGGVELSEDTDTATQSLTSDTPEYQEEEYSEEEEFPEDGYYEEAVEEGETYGMAKSVFHEDQAKGNGRCKIDSSEAHLGYVGVAATESSRLKFQVIKGSSTYNYDMPNDGTPVFFPLQSGNGSYTLRVMKNITGTKYSVAYSTSCKVTLEDEFQPFIRPNNYVNYDEYSECVQKAAQLRAESADDLEFVTKVYKLICKTVRYDRQKAKTVQSGYLPVPDETLSTGKGICFDYASLAASMLRSQGIPTKVIFGYVSPKGAYHAWNMFYTEQTGWITVNYEVSGDWTRMDLTYSANGKHPDFIGDGDNYADVYCY